MSRNKIHRTAKYATVAVTAAVVATLLISTQLYGQEKSITLESCIEAAYDSQQLTKEREKIALLTEYSSEVLNSNNKPQFNVSGHAAIQNEQVELPFSMPGVEMPDVPLYNVAASIGVSQKIYDAGLTSLQKRMEKLNYTEQEIIVETNRFKLKAEVSGLFFGVLLSRKGQQILKNSQALLQSKSKQLQGAVDAGAMLKSNLTTIIAEIYTIDQYIIEAQSTERSLINRINSLTQLECSNTTDFIYTSITVDLLNSTITDRPEIDRFYNRHSYLSEAIELENRKMMPKIIATGSAGVGNPGYNFFVKGWSPMLQAKVGLSWQPFDLGKRRDKQAMLSLQQEIITINRERVETQLTRELGAVRDEIIKQQSLIESDNKIILLREEIAKSSTSQLTHGVITSTEYLTEHTRSVESQLRRAEHTIQLEMQKANYLIIQGVK